MSFQTLFLYVSKHINKIMVNEHYNKYKTTIKKVARRNYRKRVKWLNDYLADKYCSHCKESETVCLRFYPHDTAIRKKVKRVGMNEVSRQEINELIESVEKNTNKIHEAADVFYHLIMYLEANDVKIEEVMEELNKRKKGKF